MDKSLRVTPLNSMEYSASFNTETDAVGVAVGKKDNSLIFAAALDGVLRVQSGGAASQQVRKRCTRFVSFSHPLFFFEGQEDEASFHCFMHCFVC